VFSASDPGLRLPEKIVNVHPNYPPLEGHRLAASIAVYEMVIDEQGDVCSVRGIRPWEVAPPYPAFEWALLSAMYRWKFKPATKDGEPVAVRLVVTAEVLLM
jgi:outer membrane biosynthesis protein TonB